jgi:hypothetical protein
MAKPLTVKKVRAVLNAIKPAIGERSHAFADALLAHWGTVADLVQKVVHESEVVARPVSRDDARRVVPYSYLVIAELHRLASDGSGRGF